MPCRSGDECDNSCHHEKERELLESLLCSACRALRDYEYDFALNPRLDEWWAKHRAADEKREAQETKERLERAEAKRIAETKMIVDMTKEEKKLLRKYGFV